MIIRDTGDFYTSLAYTIFAHRSGADVHLGDEWALHQAAFYGHLDVVKYLISLGADVHAEDDGALRWAERNKHTEVAEYLRGGMKR